MTNDVREFDYYKFDRKAQQSDHFCPVCHRWYKKQIKKALTDLRARLEGK